MLTMEVTPTAPGLAPGHDDDTLRSASPSERNGDARSPSRSFLRNSSPRTSSGSRKGAKLADYLCGLKKKKKSKERNGSGESTDSNGNGDGKTPKMSKFYYSPSQSSSSSSPSPTNQAPLGPLAQDESDMDVKLPSIGNGEEELELEDELRMTESEAVPNPPQESSEQGKDAVERAIDSRAGGDDQAELGQCDMDKRHNANNNSRACYSLSVHLIKGRNLVIKDKSGSSDPYVKVKIGEKTLYKTKVIYANLNPIWDEAFTIPIQDLDEPLIFKVVDYDWGSRHDYMGMCITNLRKLTANAKSEDFNLPLSMKGLAGEKSMGELSLSLALTQRTPEEQQHMLDSVTLQAQRKAQKQTWSGMLTVLLIDVQDLPARRRLSADKEASSSQGYSNVFAKLRLGNQKRRSKPVPEPTTRPEWLEQFDFYLYEGNGQTTVFEMDFFEEASVGRIPLGSVSYDISQNMAKDRTTENVLNFTNGLGRARVAITLTGFRPNTPTNDTDSTTLDEPQPLCTKYSLRNTIKLESLRDVGHLSVTVIQAQGLRAADLGGKSDPFCVLELINARVQTHTEYKTLTPNWNKTFDFDVHDITSKLEVTVYDEDRDHKRDFLGKINIPLWKIQNGKAIWYQLKNRSLAKGARGNNPQILLRMNLIWNPIRAAIKVTEPQEIKYCQPKPQLRIETFLVNMERLRLVLMDVYDIWLYIKSCLDWEYPERSLKALALYLLTCYFFQPFFIPLYCLVYWLRPWWRNFMTKRRRTTGSSRRASTANASAEDTLNLEESDDEDGEIKKLSLVEKFSILQDASGVLQELVGEVAGICESTINTYRMVVPFVYWLFAITFAAATVLFFLIDFRYVAMLFGIHEFSRVFLRPWKQATFEFYHMIRRVPHQMNLGEKLGVNSVLKSIQQLKNPATKDKFWKRDHKSAAATTNVSQTGSAWYVQNDG